MLSTLDDRVAGAGAPVTDDGGLADGGWFAEAPIPGGEEVEGAGEPLRFVGVATCNTKSRALSPVSEPCAFRLTALGSLNVAWATGAGPEPSEQATRAGALPPGASPTRSITSPAASRRTSPPYSCTVLLPPKA